MYNIIMAKLFMRLSSNLVVVSLVRVCVRKFFFSSVPKYLYFVHFLFHEPLQFSMTSIFPTNSSIKSVKIHRIYNFFSHFCTFLFDKICFFICFIYVLLYFRHNIMLRCQWLFNELKSWYESWGKRLLTYIRQNIIACFMIRFVVVFILSLF